MSFINILPSISFLFILISINLFLFHHFFLSLSQELTTPRPDSQQKMLSVKYEKKKKPKMIPPSKYPKFQSVAESNALENWQAKMRERKKQTDYLSSKYLAEICFSLIPTINAKHLCV